MMRHELYLEKSYISELETVIENINEFGVKLKNTIFYPRGGGQPEDKGVLIIQDEIYEVLEIKKFSDGVYLKINGFESLSVGDTCVQKIDWGYRYKLMK
ncbi:MAG: alanine--tRNA ligase-related protein, partial [Candidatus Kariarchaeum pelagius]